MIKPPTAKESQALEKARDKVLNRIGHNMEWRVYVIPCKIDKKAGNQDYSVITVGKAMALEWQRIVKEDCTSPRPRCRTRIEKYV